MPAKVIRSLDEHYKIRKEKTISEAKKYISDFQVFSGRMPSASEMGPFWQLFMPRDISELRRNHIFTKLSGDSEEEILNCFLGSIREYDSIEDILKS